MAIKKYADTIHFEGLRGVQQAFEKFNSELLAAGYNAGLSLEVTEVTVTTNGEGYAKVGYVSGDVYVEPLFPLVRPISDR